MRSKVKKEKIIAVRVSVGDHFDLRHTNIKGDMRLNSPDKVERVFKHYASVGASRIFWRLEVGGADIGYPVEKYSIPEYWEEWDKARERMDLIAWPVECAHKTGLELYGWVDPWNGGGPPEYGYLWEVTYCKDQPEYLAVDRTGTKRHWGILEWAYPEARQHWLEILEGFLKRYDLDGLYVDTRTEAMCPDFADQFGFNEPIVKEYERRYGVNILEEDFDLEKWRRLRGEYLTFFIREIKDLTSKYGKRFHFATNRGNYLGHPLGNMYLDWQSWVREGIADELSIGFRGWCWGKQPYGFIPHTSTWGEDIIQVYGPLCNEYGVEFFTPAQAGGKTPERLLEMPQIDGIVVGARQPFEQPFWKA